MYERRPMTDLYCSYVFERPFRYLFSVPLSNMNGKIINSRGYKMIESIENWVKKHGNKQNPSQEDSDPEIGKQMTKLVGH